jgi:peptidoglycan/LPS O-acetylase OafA/YrhL
MDDIIKITLYIFMLVIVFIFSNFLSKNKKFAFLKQRDNRYGSIDGLRGYLAISVFVHHFMLTWYWKNTGHWYRPQELYFQNIGLIGVMLFFMITGFLFTSKLIKDKGKTNWLKLYKSRFFRIYPLYLFAIVLISMVVFFYSKEPIKDYTLLINQYFKWLIFHGENIHTHTHTPLIIAGVDWSLKYEWLFYLFLPILAIFLKFNRWFLLIISLFAISFFLNDYKIYTVTTIHFIYFIIGAITSFLYTKKEFFKDFINLPVVTVIILFLLGKAIFVENIYYKNAYYFTPMVYVSIFFIAIALGNDLFGLLKHKASIFLGEISYSLYLLHGFIIYLAFTTFEIIDLREISSIEHTLMLPILAIFVVIFSTFTYTYIEAPAIAYGKKSN